jgi:hypothetical protein
VQKERYIEVKIMENVTYPRETRSFLSAIFDSVEKYEQEYGKDVCNWTTNRVLEYYKLLNYSSIEALFNLNSQLKIYTQWCFNEGLVQDGINHFAEIFLTDLSACVNKAKRDKLVLTRNEIMDMVSQLTNPRDQFIILALYEFGGNDNNFYDLAALKIQHLDEKNNLLNLPSGRAVKISDELKQICIDAAATLQYYTIQAEGSKREPLRELFESDYVIKDLFNTEFPDDMKRKGRRIFFCLRRCFNSLGYETKELTANKIAESGQLNMIVQMAKAKNMDPKSFLYTEDVSIVKKQYNKRFVPKQYILKYGDYLV